MTLTRTLDRESPILLSRQTKEFPLILSKEQVLSVLQGRLGQVRCPLDPQPQCPGRFESVSRDWYMDPGGRSKLIRWLCPFGTAGSPFWLKESILVKQRRGDGTYDISYEADDQERAGVSIGLARPIDPGTILPASAMPKSAARIALRIEHICVDYLQNVSTQDMNLEGFRTTISPSGAPVPAFLHYRRWWNSLYALPSPNGNYAGSRYISYAWSFDDFRLLFGDRIRVDRKEMYWRRGLSEFPMELQTNPRVWVCGFRVEIPDLAS